MNILMLGLAPNPMEDFQALLAAIAAGEYDELAGSAGSTPAGNPATGWERLTQATSDLAGQGKLTTSQRDLLWTTWRERHRRLHSSDL